MGLGAKADARPSGDGKRRGMADGGARVPGVLTASELEGFVAGVVGPELLETSGGVF